MRGLVILANYEAIYALVRRIPAGRVCGYAQLGARLGHPRYGRVVGAAMRACDDPGVPCHRVIRSDGRLAAAFGAGGSALQRALLRSEGVKFLPDGRVDMARCGWR